MTRVGSSVWTWTLTSSGSPTTSTELPRASISPRITSVSSDAPSMRNSGQYPHPPSGRSSATCAAFGFGATMSMWKVSACSNVLSIPSRMICKPTPPASTTPASRRVWTWLGVFVTAALAPPAAAAITPGTVASTSLAAAAAARPASRATVRMVPSVGLLTARYAALAASSKASASSLGVSELLPSTALAKPRKICDRITPELPRAPIRLPCEANLAILLTSAAFDSLMSSTADCSVSNMLVPVSPSGTGNTLRRLTSSWLADSQVRLPSRACLNRGPSTPAGLREAIVEPHELRGCAASSRGPLHSAPLFLDALDVHVDLHNRDVHRPLDLELDRLLKVVGDLGDAHPVLHDHVQVDGEPTLDLEHVGAAIHALPAQQLRHAVPESSRGHS